MFLGDGFTERDGDDEHWALVPVGSAHLWSLGQANATGLEEIVEALSKLSTDEICALKEVVDRKLSKKVDFLTLLPQDLRIAVLKWLGPEDFWPCIQVSRQWRHILLDIDCIKIISRNLHPGLLEMAAHGTKDVKEATSTTILHHQIRAFKEASLYSFSWHNGGVATMFFQRPWLSSISEEPNQQLFCGNGKLVGSCPLEKKFINPYEDPNLCLFGDSLYSSGRLVCQPYWNPTSSPGPAEWFLIVDDFTTMTRRTLRVPQIYGDLCQRVRLFCVGESLVVARDITHRRLAIWSLSGDDNFNLARLPRRIDRAVTAGDVVIGTYRVGEDDDPNDMNGNYDLHGMKMWRWTRDNGGRVLEWTLAEPANFAAELIGLRRNCVRHAHSILIHPRDESIVYLFVASLLPTELAMGEPDPETVTMAVFEVTGKQISGRWKMKLQASWLDELSDPDNFGFKPVDRHGSYSTATRQQDGPQPGTLCHERVLFNIYTKKLTLVSSVVPLYSSTLYGKTLLWEDKYITWQEPPDRYYSHHSLPLVITPAFASERIPHLSPRPLTSVPYRRFPVRSGCDCCSMQTAFGGDVSETQEARVNHGDTSSDKRPYADLGKYPSLHQLLEDLAPRLIPPKDMDLSPLHFADLRIFSRYFTETYASMEVCHLDSTMFCGEGSSNFDQFPIPWKGANRAPIALRHAITQGHQQPSPEILTRFPLMWMDGKYMVLFSWMGYMVWEFRSPRIESSQ
ncbi:hypothetical protein PgNI_05506 [Pyricularia grisea]|uniref:F-box domain-containing protein n=1 Tax=Pyricularia grisea TaxID=148305 RepID=A0A6P8B573_PYRGI|nr:hypothetical protein PgNI_05506 [Pyricularia grisea]TLD10491.1 hypothetical protein PgNI_05506 [Pyricularia grisea]